MNDEMDRRVLVAYATKYGATAEIAERIGEELRHTGLDTDVRPVNSVKDLSAYKAIVAGSAVYVGRWRKEAVRFIKTNERTLAERKVWLFSSGPTGEGNPVELTKGWHFPKSLQLEVESIRPQDITLFHGSVEMKKLNPLHKWMINKVDAPRGDFRDWETIVSWAKSIANVLKKTE